MIKKIVCSMHLEGRWTVRCSSWPKKVPYSWSKATKYWNNLWRHYVIYDVTGARWGGTDPQGGWQHRTTCWTRALEEEDLQIQLPPGTTEEPKSQGRDGNPPRCKIQTPSSELLRQLFWWRHKCLPTFYFRYMSYKYFLYGMLFR